MDFCKQLNEEGVKYQFHLIGDGEMLEDVKTFLNREGLIDNLVLHGHIDNRAEMNSILRSSDIFFFPSLSEGSPRVVIEAMAQGTPVIATPVGSLPGTFKDGETIRFFGFNDAKAAVGIIKEYLADATPFDQQRNAAYKMVAEQFTIEKFLSKVFVYEA
jgi:glycosyltransferase involved in cell wall biosynthesis